MFQRCLRPMPWHFPLTWMKMTEFSSSTVHSPLFQEEELCSPLPSFYDPKRQRVCEAYSWGSYLLTADTREGNHSHLYCGEEGKGESCGTTTGEKLQLQGPLTGHQGFKAPVTCPGLSVITCLRAFWNRGKHLKSGLTTLTLLNTLDSS